MTLLIHILANSLGILIAAELIAGVSFSEDLMILLMAGLILGLVNFFVKPILKILSFPLILLTFGIFSFILNILILWFVAKITPGFIISGIMPLVWTTIIISATNTVISVVVKK